MQIVQYPHPALRHKAEPVKALSKEIELLAGGMLELMYKHEGLGLAAPQVASALRVLSSISRPTRRRRITSSSPSIP